MVDWSGRKVVIIGAARQGIALARYLARHGARLVLNDRKPAGELQEARALLGDLSAASVEWVLGEHPFEILDGADLVCPSGGIPLDLPLVVEARRRGIPLSNDSQIFLEAAPCPVIGITGSAGKTTTTTLVGRIAEAAGKGSGSRLKAQPMLGNLPPATFNHVWVGGNIGLPLIAWLDEMQPGDLAVMELSSFQLELMTVSPQMAAVLNITPNHLDRHADMEAYIAAKRRILEFQDAGPAGVGCTAVLNREDAGAWSLAGEARGRLVSFGLNAPQTPQAGTFVRGDVLYWSDGQEEVALMAKESVELRGAHNLLNVLAAAAIACAAGMPPEAVREGVAGFRGVAHRLEFIRRWRGASWYNDSIATAPERTIAAMRSFTEPLVLLAGGKDKNLPWDEFAALARQRVKHLVLFGEAAEKIEQALQAEKEASGQEWPYTLSKCRGLRQAIQEAANHVQPGDVVLLSPGGTSFDEFRDFEERGEVYRTWVKELI